MKLKLLNLGLIIASLFGYLEWSGNSHAFIFQTEAEIFLKLFSDPGTVIHPFTILPLIGQIMLLITLFQKKPGRILTYSGMVCLGILLLFMAIIGGISGNMKILASTLPFIVISYLTLRYHKNKKHNQTAD